MSRRKVGNAQNTPEPQRQLVSSPLAVYSSSGPAAYSFGTRGLFAHSRSRSPSSLQPQPRELWPRRDSASKPGVATDARRFFSHFQSLTAPADPQPSPESLGTYYRELNAQPVSTSPIESIRGLPRDGTQYGSALGLPPADPEPACSAACLYAFQFTHDFEKQSCEAIADELGGARRRALRGQREAAREAVIDLKDMALGSYAEVVLERSENLLFESIMKNFGSLSINEMVNLPEKYEIKERKDVKSTGNSPLTQKSTPTPTPPPARPRPRPSPTCSSSRSSAKSSAGSGPPTTR